MAKEDAAALAATIAATGFTETVDDNDCVAFSPATSEANKAIHAKANDQLLRALLDNSAGHCIHITGEMRALADPFHRRLCAELAKRVNTRFTIVYDIRRGVQQDAGRSWEMERTTLGLERLDREAFCHEPDRGGFCRCSRIQNC